MVLLTLRQTFFWVIKKWDDALIVLALVRWQNFVIKKDLAHLAKSRPYLMAFLLAILSVLFSEIRIGGQRWLMGLFQVLSTVAPS